MTKIAHFLAVLIYAKEDLCIKPKKPPLKLKITQIYHQFMVKKIL
ncbi:hypothetical protein BAZSYMA_ACONTIG47013_0 [Bathymodiolus azoricus thioautotrophic gill symbiont]|uniref:Uncharacterized protein n=1 Tax=Bathymodiolus azoricus thioautotrophic gill symbiont TaxID=235205 RepID=A0A1H6LH16_9GAMM|nr:hypothetical protein BAZSYMA_ACONTIG47013_0 [Bathymodiolus azoricus thioautotrophic gill symbiont]